MNTSKSNIPIHENYVYLCGMNFVILMSVSRSAFVNNVQLYDYLLICNNSSSSDVIASIIIVI